VFALASRFAPAPPRVPAVAKGALILVAVGVAIAAIMAAEPRERFETFKQTPAGLETSIESHLFSTSGNGRWQMWTSAVDQFEADPVLGQGAGSYEAWWAQHGTIALFIRDAHSLYLEVLGELGVVGLALLLALFAFVAAAGVRRLLAADHDERPAVAALLALLVAYAFEAGVDWMWEVPAVSLIAFACAGLVTGPATIFPDEAGFSRTRTRRQRSARAFRAAGVVLALGLMLAQAVPFLASIKIEQSREAVAAGQLEDALADALAAREIQPWAATPHLQIALVYETAGDFEAAWSSIEAAIEHDRLDWRLWVIGARIQTKAGAFDEAEASLDRAVALNPRSPLLAGL
ncbi:MAG: O-antigen ligase family protein, partial [Actinomycetota bacterium]|nr:O-antigen ligase family protein [Actinomycetota bacterium]